MSPQIPARVRSPFRLAGFTLVEILVTVTLLSVLMLALGSALRTTVQTEERVDARLSRVDNIRTVTHLLRSVVGQVSAHRVNLPDGRAFQFLAGPRDLQWVGIMPARHGMGGRYFFRLGVESMPDRSDALVLRYLPWDPQSTAFPNWDTAPSRVVASQLSAFEVQAQALHPTGASRQSNWPRGFQTGWPVTDAIPEVIRLMIVDAGGPWPDLVIPVRPTARTDASLSPFVAGGVNQ